MLSAKINQESVNVNMIFGLLKKIAKIRGAISKHLLMQNYRPYEAILKRFRNQGDIWMCSQGEFIQWWMAREQASLHLTVVDGICIAKTNLEGGVIEQFQQQFLEADEVACPNTTFQGEVYFSIDPDLPAKEVLIEVLKREGILNFRVEKEGPLLLSKQEFGPLVEQVAANLSNKGRLFDEDVEEVRQALLGKLAAYNLPLLRVWYHPCINGTVIKAVFSPRYDVDRAISLLGYIRQLEQKYQVSSTLYVRAFCPFYTDEMVKHLATQPWCSEIGLHGEFVTNARHHGDELQAAKAEKEKIETLIGRPILGVCMHGGEMSSNTTNDTPDIVQQVGLLYDTTPNMRYYFPFKKMIEGQLSRSYSLIHPTGDIKMPATLSYSQTFYEQVVAKMDEIYQHNGVFVLMLHPVYFGFFRYLFNPVNWRPFWSFFKHYFRAGSPSLITE